MPLIATYATSAELKAYLRITDVADDAEIGFAIEAASRAIDQDANRHFGSDNAPVARYYSFEADRVVQQTDLAFMHRQGLWVDDVSTTTGLTVKLDDNDDGVFETTLVLDTNFRLYPLNAAAESRPWERIVLEAGETFPRHPRGVEVTARFGWAATPTAVKQACLIQAARFFKRREAPFGIAGSPELGSEMRLLARLDPDVATVVRSYKRHWAFG